MMNNAVKKGLIMEGGAMRGMFTCGVIDVMMENKIEYDGAVGVSAGATFGVNYKSKQLGRAIRYNKKYIADKRYGSFRSLIKTGNIFDTDFCYDELPNKLDVFDTETFMRNPMEFYVVATNVETGKPVYHKLKDGLANDLDWIRASASIPMLSRVVEVDGYKLLDGGMADSIPVRFFERLGYNRNVAILTRPFSYVKKKEFTKPAHLLLHKYPNLINTMENRPEMYNETTHYIRERELEGKLFVIRPPKTLAVPNLTNDPNELEAAYQLGREVMTGRMDELKAYLEL